MSRRIPVVFSLLFAALAVVTAWACADANGPTGPLTLAPAQGSGIGTPCSAEGRVWGLVPDWAFSCQHGLVVEFHFTGSCSVSTPLWAAPIFCQGFPGCSTLPPGAPPANCDPSR